MAQHRVDGLTIDETSRLLRVSRWTIWRAVRDRLLQVVVVDGPGRDGAKRITRASLVALVASCTVAREQPGDQHVGHNTDPDLDLMTFEEFAAETGISKRVLDDMARNRGLTHIRFGKTRYLNRTQRAEFLKAHTVTTKVGDELEAVRARVQRQLARKRNTGRV
ncbi:hypothetical protein KBX50_04665 [Micromonospora sp. C51]|uniref:hypothetical protein n=1 Tax=Micromonospora sp. C51 TaxID=2824879 RepID=UPI001B368338|nr:hypothetical protein [Micromonospora sp. C51]MBQ1047781.1 hypothetical protein [Micromonospora sp. C51]